MIYPVYCIISFFSIDSDLRYGQDPSRESHRTRPDEAGGQDLAKSVIRVLWMRNSAVKSGDPVINCCLVGINLIIHDNPVLNFLVLSREWGLLVWVLIVMDQSPIHSYISTSKWSIRNPKDTNWCKIAQPSTEWRRLRYGNRIFTLLLPFIASKEYTVVIFRVLRERMIWRFPEMGVPPKSSI